MRRRSLLATVGRAAPLRLLNRAGAAAMPLLLATWYGRSAATDLYGVMAALFTLAGSLLFACFQDSALVPVVMDLERRQPDALPRFVGALVAHTALLAALLATVLGGIATLVVRAHVVPAVVPLVAPLALGFSLYLPALALRSLGSGLLAARFAFVADAAAGAVGMLVTLAVALGFHRQGLPAVAFALASGEAVAAVLVFAALRRGGLRIVLNGQRTSALRRLAHLVAAQIGGAALVRVNPLADQLVAQALGAAGGATLLRLSNDLGTVGTSLLGPLFLSILLSHLAERGDAADAGAHFRRTLNRSLVLVVAALAALALLLFICRAPLVDAVYGRGAMDRAGLDGIARLLPYHLLGVPALGALMVLSRAHVSLGNSRILASMGALNAGLNLVLNVALGRALGLPGIALGTSLVNVGVALVFWLRLGRARARLARAEAATSCP